MGTFFIGFGVGGMVGAVLTILVLARGKNEPYEYLGRKRDELRRMAAEQEQRAKEIPDALGQAKVEGLWEALKALYED